MGHQLYGFFVYFVFQIRKVKPIGNKSKDYLLMSLCSDLNVNVKSLFFSSGTPSIMNFVVKYEPEEEGWISMTNFSHNTSHKVKFLAS